MIGITLATLYSGEIAGNSSHATLHFGQPGHSRHGNVKELRKFRRQLTFAGRLQIPDLPACRKIENVCLRAEMGWNRNVDAKRTVGQLNDVVPCFSFKWSWEAAERKQQLKWDKLNCWNGNILCCLWLLVSCRFACLLSAALSEQRDK